MFKLVAQTEQWPRWIELIPAHGKDPAVEGHFSKITRSMKRRARLEVQRTYSQAEEADRDQIDLFDAADLISQSIIRQGLLDWRGIGDARGKPLKMTPEAVELALSDDTFFEAADAKYVEPEMVRELEKNGSSASRNGTGGAGTQAKDTATSPATLPRKAGANRTKRPAKKAAPTSSTSREPMPVKESGI